MIELPPNTPWEEKVQAEVMNYVSAVQQNIKHGLNVSLAHLPDAKSPEQRAIQLDYFLDASVGLLVQIFCTFVDPSAPAELETKVLDGVIKKFAYVREKHAEAKKPKLVTGEA